MRDRLNELQAAAPTPSEPQPQPEIPSEPINDKDKKSKSKKEKKSKKSKSQPPSEQSEKQLQQSNPEMDEFFESAAQIKADSAAIDVSIAQLLNVQGDSLHAATEKDISNYNEMIESAINTTNKLCSDFRRKLKAMEKSNFAFEYPPSDTPKHSEGDIRIRKVQFAQISNKFLRSIGAFQQAQQDHRQRLRDAMARQYLIVNPDASEEQIAELKRGEGQTLLEGQVFAVGKKATLRAMQSRQDALESMERTLLELSALFSDMSAMVALQGEQIDAIAEHVASAGTYVEEGGGVLVEAVKKQKARRCTIL